MRRNLLGLMTMVACAMLVAVAALPDGAGEAAGSAQSYRKLTPVELKAMLERKDFLFVNVHIPYEGEIDRTDASIPFDKVDQQVHFFPANKDAKIVLYCMSGRMSGMAADTLVRLGYTNVSHLEGGMIAWRKSGYALKDSPSAR
jgi:rhodanese-related sulfurtransferase